MLAGDIPNFIAILGTAETDAITEKEIEFVNSMVQKHIDYGDRMLVSERQLDWLKEISGR